MGLGRRGGGGRAGCHQKEVTASPQRDGMRPKGCAGSGEELLPRQTAACRKLVPRRWGWLRRRGRDVPTPPGRLARAGSALLWQQGHGELRPPGPGMWVPQLLSCHPPAAPQEGPEGNRVRENLQSISQPSSTCRSRAESLTCSCQPPLLGTRLGDTLVPRSARSNPPLHLEPASTFPRSRF